MHAYTRNSCQQMRQNALILVKTDKNINIYNTYHTQPHVYILRQEKKSSKSSKRVEPFSKQTKKKLKKTNRKLFRTEI